MAVKEKDLEVIESLQEGDKLRVVTSEGNSRNIDINKVNSLVITIIKEDNFIRLNKTWQEIYDAVILGRPCTIIQATNEANYERIYIEPITQISKNIFGPNIFYAVIDSSNTTWECRDEGDGSGANKYPSVYSGD